MRAVALFRQSPSDSGLDSGLEPTACRRWRLKYELILLWGWLFSPTAASPKPARPGVASAICDPTAATSSSNDAGFSHFPDREAMPAGLDQVTGSGTGWRRSLCRAASAELMSVQIDTSQFTRVQAAVGACALLCWRHCTPGAPVSEQLAPVTPATPCQGTWADPGGPCPCCPLACGRARQPLYPRTCAHPLQTVRSLEEAEYQCAFQRICTTGAVTSMGLKQQVHMQRTSCPVF